MTAEKPEPAKLPDGFLESVERCYTPSEWALEGEATKGILADVANKIRFNYEFVEPIARGGSGLVVKVLDRHLKVNRALKVSRPSPGKQVLLADILGREADTILRLAHNNLVQIYARGLTEGDPNTPFYVMQYVEGVKDCDAYFAEGPPLVRVLEILRSILAVMEFVHSQGLIHMDLKPGNILIRPDGQPLVTDFGFAKWLTTGHELTLVGGTEGYMHPGARRYVQSVATDPRRLTGNAPRSELKPEWDLFSLGKTFLRLLHVLDASSTGHLEPYVRRYINLLACRLLDGQNSSGEDGIGLGLESFQEIAYKSAREGRKDLEKLTGEFDLTKRIPELDLFAPKTIQTSTVATTPFTNRLQDILNDPAYKRLSVFTQLGLLNLVYPTANHTRFEHSLGTFSLLCRYVSALYNDPYNPFFKQVMQEEDLKAVLLAALLHDLGQFPMAHDVEEADPFISHEAIGAKILRGSVSLRRIIEEQWGVKPERLIAIFEANPTQLSSRLRDRIMHSLVSGPLDADKVDYLLRDSRHLGLCYADALDVERFLRCLTIVYRREGDTTYAALGIHEKGKIAAETIAFVRYAMFGQVYWHHTYRAIKVMLYHIIWEAMRLAGEGLSELRASFREMVSGSAESDGQLNLFGTGSATRIAPLHASDFAVLEWWASRASQRGRSLVELIYSRRLFKRVAVRSKDHPGSGDTWEKATDFFRRHRRSPAVKLELQGVLQRKIREAIEKRATPSVQSSSVATDMRNEFIGEAAEQVEGSSAKPQMFLVLLDVPPERQPDIPLEFVLEDDRRSLKLNELAVSSAEASRIWKSLMRESHGTLGKVRLYVHPKYGDFVASYLSKAEIDKAIQEAIAEVDR